MYEHMLSLRPEYSCILYVPRRSLTDSKSERSMSGVTIRFLLRSSYRAVAALPPTTPQSTFFREVFIALAPFRMSDALTHDLLSAVLHISESAVLSARDVLSSIDEFCDMNVITL